MENINEILEFSTPGEAGLSPAWINGFLDEIERRRLMLHSIMFIRHGKVAAEGYYAPFCRDELHRMYSVSKSFVSTAIGALIDEGKLTLDDKITPFFPDKCPEFIHPYIADMTIRDLLTMATPYSSGTTYRYYDKDWAWTFFNSEPDHPAGTIFNYDTSASYVLDVIVERITGKPFIEYLKDKMLREIGFSENAWCVKAPEGNSWGGSGVQCSTRDLARLAMLYRNGGSFNGKQLLSAEWISEATSTQIDNAPSGHKCLLSGNGYGYQIWRTAEEGYCFTGMGGQLALTLPKHDLIMVCTGDVQGHPTNYTGVIESLWNNIVYKLNAGEKPLSSPDEEAALRARLASLSCVLPDGKLSSSISDEVSGKVYKLGKNPMGIKSISLTFNGDSGMFHYDTIRGEKEFAFGFGKYEFGSFPETSYYGNTIGTPSGKGYRMMSSAVWTEEKKLVLRTYLIDDYFGNFTATFSFKGKQVGLTMMKCAEWFLGEYEGFAGGYTE